MSLSTTSPPATDLPGFWLKWLTLATVVTVLFGLSMTTAPELTKQIFGLMVFQNAAHFQTVDAQAVKYMELTHAVMGSVMVGWGALMFMLVRRLSGPIAESEAGQTLKMLGLSLLLWYLPDTAFSIHSGFWQNAVLNTGFMVLFTPPLLALKKYL
jgi:hypothetical protein